MWDTGYYAGRLEESDDKAGSTNKSRLIVSRKQAGGEAGTVLRLSDQAICGPDSLLGHAH